MRRLLQHSLSLACALAFAHGISSAQDNRQADVKSELTAAQAAIEQLRAEVVQLRKDVMRLELERRRDVIRQLKAELETVRAERARLVEFDRTREQDLRDLEELMAAKDVAAGDLSEMEVARGELAVARAREIDQLSEAVRGHENELLRRLQTEEQLIQRLEKAWKVLGGNTQ